MGTAKTFVAMVPATVIKVRTVAIATTADVLIMKNANGTFARLIAVMEDATVTRTVGSAAVTALVLVIRDVIILEAVILIVAMENAMVMRIVSHVMIVVVTRTKNVLLVQPMLIQEVVLTGVVTVL